MEVCVQMIILLYFTGGSCTYVVARIHDAECATRFNRKSSIDDHMHVVSQESPVESSHELTIPTGGSYGALKARRCVLRIY
eukprot:1195741-Prorocentrum_minimum.AAC.3